MSKLVCLDDIKEKPVPFLWRPYIPLAKLTVMDGDPEVGKGYLESVMTGAVTRGRALPGSHKVGPGNVLFMSTEDGLADTIKPRLKIMGADPKRVFAVNTALTLDPDGFKQLESYLKQKRPMLVIIDPLFAYFGADKDPYRANHTRPIMAQLGGLAERYNCAVLIIRHLTKSQMSRAIYRGQGNIDILAACRSALLVGYNPFASKERVLVHIKSNISAKGKTLAFSIKNDGKLVWKGTRFLTAAHILGRDGAKGAELFRAKAFLRDLLADGPVSSKKALAAATKNGISLATLKRAQKSLKIKAVKSGFAKSGGWSWELPSTP